MAVAEAIFAAKQCLGQQISVVAFAVIEPCQRRKAEVQLCLEASLEITGDSRMWVEVYLHAPLSLAFYYCDLVARAYD